MNKQFFVICTVLIVVSLAVGVLIGSRVTIPTTFSGYSSTTSSTTICTLSSGTDGVVIRVVQENYSDPAKVFPVSGALVNGNDVYYCGSDRSQVNFSPVRTNSSGWASLLFGGIGIYTLEINLSEELNYTISIQTVLVSTTYVVYNVSTGNVTTGVCSQFRSNCEIP